MIIKQNRGKQWLGRQRRMVTVAQVAGIGACVWLLASLVFGEMGILRYLAMREHSDRLDGELKALREETASLRNDITRLQQDPAKIERVARERLGYVRRGETVYQLAPDHTAGQERPEQP